MGRARKPPKSLMTRGEWFLTRHKVISETAVGDKKIIISRSTYDLKGDLKGKWVGELQTIEIDLDTGNARGDELKAHFIGTVFGKHGSFGIKDKWTVVDGWIPPSPFRILKGTGTGDLANIQGKGSYWGSAEQEKGEYAAWIRL